MLFIVLFGWMVPFRDSYTAEANGAVIEIEGGIFAAIGFAMVAAAILAVIRDRDLPTLVCSFWLLGIFVFATFLNWSFTSKTLLPAAPAAMILLSRWRERVGLAEITLSRWIAPILLGPLSLWITWADYRQANTARDAAQPLAMRILAAGLTALFTADTAAAGGLDRVHQQRELR